MNDALIAAAQTRIDALRAADPDNAAPVPVDRVTASASGLHPHIRPAAAAYQMARVAWAGGGAGAGVGDAAYRKPILGGCWANRASTC